MNDFRTEIDVDFTRNPISYDSNLLFVGSCFATNIGRYFSANYINACVNPFGVLYNPISIANSLRRLLDNNVFTLDDVLRKDGQYHTFFHHSSFNRDNQQDFLSTVNKAFQESQNHLTKTDFLIITFGTAYVFEHEKRSMVVSNCHKYPSKDFKRYPLSVDQIVKVYKELIIDLRTQYPNQKVIFTVSPVRHWKDGAHGNQLSKATLLLAIEELGRLFTHVSYFPAYELLLDDLRDYRFFSDDMLHPSDKAIEYIRAKFIASQYDDFGQSALQKLRKLLKAAEHRPFSIRSSAHQAFVAKHIEKVDVLQKQLAGINLTGLRKKFEEQLI
ncbi:GSCFA domain-containing protein [Carboxylicivirga sp. M1479]|uniref:GSCFA domain-containing protein n=1 Tax=Carboxylicivirga sp. M1479 TaxID=2594476 RepID=UPI001177EBFF|nr:GSCFA domain-containing protein [Carboxylicivirga sp. M1479]TRX72044.1 GSCFA domain-containing protein [Carboxylicivirga sp. M1479]